MPRGYFQYAGSQSHSAFGPKWCFSPLPNFYWEQYLVATQPKGGVHKGDTHGVGRAEIF